MAGGSQQASKKSRFSGASTSESDEEYGAHDEAPEEVAFC
jgi:hypothetical protein